MTEAAELRFWAVLYVQGEDGSCEVSVTDGVETPHTVAAVRAGIEADHGRVDRLSAVGPMGSEDEAEEYARNAVGTDAGLAAWLALAE